MSAKRRAPTLSGTPNARAEENLAAYKESGCKVLSGWDRNGPYVERLPSGAWQITHRSFLDHLYRLRTALAPGVNVRTTYVTEPYGLSAESLLELMRLSDDGWTVEIGKMPLWLPGATVPVLIRKREI